MNSAVCWAFREIIRDDSGTVLSHETPQSALLWDRWVMLPQYTKTFYDSSLEGKKKNRTKSNLSDFSLVETQREDWQTRKAEEKNVCWHGLAKRQWVWEKGWGVVQSSLRGKEEEMLKELEAVSTGEHLMVTRDGSENDFFKVRSNVKLHLTSRNLLLLALFPFLWPWKVSFKHRQYPSGRMLLDPRSCLGPHSLLYLDGFQLCFSYTYTVLNI